VVPGMIDSNDRFAGLSNGAFFVTYLHLTHTSPCAHEAIQ